MAYKSKYYDPAKAHEYYEKHKKLKGRNKRTSTADLNDIGKQTAKAVKESVMAEKKEFMNKLKEAMNAKIKNIRARMKGMSAEQKEQLKNEILALKEEYKGNKEKVKQYYDEVYAQELDKMRADGSMKKVAKKRGRKKKAK